MCEASGNALDGENLKRLFLKIGERMAEIGAMAEIALYGGSAMILSVGCRENTSDIDYVFIDGDTEALCHVSSEIGAEEDLPHDWFNDAVSLAASDMPEYSLLGEFPGGGRGLRVFSATPEYLLSMKLLKMRSGLESHDVEDVWNLLDHCGISDVDEARQYIETFFKGEDLPERNSAILSDILSAKAVGEPYNPMIGW